MTRPEESKESRNSVSDVADANCNEDNAPVASNSENTVSETNCRFETLYMHFFNWHYANMGSDTSIGISS